MTVYVGDKPFSSVRAVLQEQVSSVADSSGQAVKRSLKGEAVIIEANSRTYYALLGKPDEPEYGQKVANYALLPLVPEFRRNPETDMLSNSISVTWATILARSIAASTPALPPPITATRLPLNRGP